MAKRPINPVHQLEDELSSITGLRVRRQTEIEKLLIMLAIELRFSYFAAHFGISLPSRTGTEGEAVRRTERSAASAS